jgi:hypothetical protein
MPRTKKPPTPPDKADKEVDAMIAYYEGPEGLADVAWTNAQKMSGQFKSDQHPGCPKRRRAKHVSQTEEDDGEN